MSLRQLRLLAFGIIILISSTLFAEPTHLTVLHFNDFHGHLESECAKNKCEGGVARMAEIVKNIEEENARKGWKTVLLFGGDAFSGTLISSEFKGEAEFKVFNAMGVDAMVLGNHDFDYSLPVIEKRMREASFPVIAANVREKDGRNLLTNPTATIVLDPAGPSIVLVGLTSKYTPRMTNPVNVAELYFTDPIKAAKEFTKYSKQHVLIALTHEGVDADVKLAQKTKGFDAIVGGHDHVKPSEYCRTVKKIPVCQTPANGKYLGRLDFEIEGHKANLTSEELIPVKKEPHEDAAVAAIVAGYSKKIGPKYDKAIATAITNIPTSRGEKSAMGALVADSIRETAKTEIGFINSGGLRTSIKKGPITSRKISEVLPFDNYIVSFNLTGKELSDLIDFSLSHGHGSFLQFSGVSYEADGKIATGIMINGKPLDPKKTYTAATVDFITNGGDGYTMLKSKKTSTANVLVRDALIEYVKEKKTVSAKSPTSSL